jgi:hypothetical protein
MAGDQASTVISVRYTQGTYVARAKGHKPTASCVYDAGLAAKALVRKLGLDEGSLTKTVNGRDCLEFTASKKVLSCAP